MLARLHQDDVSHYISGSRIPKMTPSFAHDCILGGGIDPTYKKHILNKQTNKNTEVPAEK